MLASYLMGSPGFAVSGAGSVPTVEPFGLLAALPEDVVAAARRWRDHIVEVETGLPPDAAAGAAPRPEYDAARTTLVQREQAKAAELGVGFRTVERHRARYDSQGLWGLVDQRAVRTWDAAGRADARLVEMVREVIAAETDVSTGTRARLIRRVIKRVEQIHGPGVVPLPGQTAFTH
ncbi:MAG: putative transposase [Pseudonocardiales bacterium]|nr:putative transposase [Pseudonocardiales bacterium]